MPVSPEYSREGRICSRPFEDGTEVLTTADGSASMDESHPALQHPHEADGENVTPSPVEGGTQSCDAAHDADSNFSGTPALPFVETQAAAGESEEITVNSGKRARETLTEDESEATHVWQESSSRSAAEEEVSNTPAKGDLQATREADLVSPTAAATRESSAVVADASRPSGSSVSEASRPLPSTQSLPTRGAFGNTTSDVTDIGASVAAE